MDEVMAHVALGMPSKASKKSPNDYLVARNEYVISYNSARKVPNWVSWRVRPGDMVSHARHNGFRTDRTIPKAWGRAGEADYKGSGYTRGHMVASGERHASSRANSKTFVHTNILPQSRENNMGPWADLEQYCKEKSLVHNKTVHIVAGGIYEGKALSIGAGKVSVPSATWKVAVFLDKGQTMKDVNADTHIVSVIIPNRVGAIDIKQGFIDFRVPVKAIEARTKLSLFAALPKSLRTELKSRIDKRSDELMTPKGRKQMAKKAVKRVEALDAVAESR